MHRIGFVGIAIVAVLALAFTAAAVDTGLDTLDHERPDGDGEVSLKGTAGGGGPTNDTRQTGNGSAVTQSSGEGSEGQTETADGPAVWQVVASIVLFTVGGVVIVYGLTRGEEVDLETEERKPGSSRSKKPADRPRLTANVPPSNDVYRIWLALREEVDPDSSSSSPAEIAATAIEQGFDERAVETLHEEFCAVRYGPVSPSEERERRARNVGRRLGITEGDD